jgi:hypothetical protein
MGIFIQSSRLLVLKRSRWRLSHDFKFLTATVIFTEHGINVMLLEANPTVSPFLMVSNNMVNVKHKAERSDKVQLVYSSDVR